jgi:excisionase family DNA binding protein
MLYGRKEAAATLSLGVRTLDALILSGAIPVVRVGRRVLVAREALLRFVNKEQSRTDASQEAL